MQIFTALRSANCAGRDQQTFPPICHCDLEIRSRSIILFSNGRPGQNIWVHKIVSRYAENSASEVDPRLENKNTEIPSKLENAYIVSETLKPTTLASGNQESKILKVCGKNALLVLSLRIKHSRNSNIVLLKRCTFHSKFYLKQDKNCLSVLYFLYFCTKSLIYCLQQN